MNEAERAHRAMEAQRLVDDPLLNEALERMQADASRELLALGPLEHEQRWLMACKINVIEGFRDELRTAVQVNTVRKGPAVA